jgi:hypothetical protein
VPSFEASRVYLQAALKEMQAYLLSAQLFWPLSGLPVSPGSPFPHLTLGNVILAFDALAAADAAAGGARCAERQRLEAQWEAQRTRWAVHVEAKAQRELASRLRQWKAYVEDVCEARRAEDYTSSVRPRLIAERLLGLLPQGTEVARECEQLHLLDSRIAPYLQAGPFVMDSALQAGYPEQAFPFLYRRSHSDTRPG